MSSLDSPVNHIELLRFWFMCHLASVPTNLQVVTRSGHMCRSTRGLFCPCYIC